MARGKSAGSGIQVRQFASLDEIERAITKLRRRIDDVRGLDPLKLRFDAQEINNVESNIRRDILAIFGEHSPEHREHVGYVIYKGGFNLNDGDYDRQRKFAAGIPEAATMLEGLIRALEEHKTDFTPPTPTPTREGAPTRPSADRTTFNIQGNVQRLALGDITEQNISVVVLLGAIQKAVEESTDIPAEEKRTLLEKLRDLVNNQWIAGLGTGVALEVIKAACGFH